MTDDICAERRTITSVTPTICSLMGVEPPTLCADTPVDAVLEDAQAAGVERAGKALVYAPDAIGTLLFNRYRPEFDAVLERAPVRVPCCSVMPSKTPVCYSSVFTGAMPESHGLTEAVRPRPTLRVDTLFDALIRAEKRVGIAARGVSSIGRLFREREMEYYPGDADEDVMEHALEWIHSSHLDVVVVYNNKADKVQHRTGPYSEETHEAVAACIENFGLLSAAVDESWGVHHRLVCFVPDHGQHEREDGRGSHGDYVVEDMQVEHFWDVRHAG